jgi:hypothetical protein
MQEALPGCARAAALEGGRPISGEGVVERPTRRRVRRAGAAQALRLASAVAETDCQLPPINRTAFLMIETKPISVDAGARDASRADGKAEVENLYCSIACATRPAAR